jgi:hypothetical protein
MQRRRFAFDAWFYESRCKRVLSRGAATGSEHVSIRAFHRERSEPDRCSKVFLFVTQLVFTHCLRFCSSDATRWQKKQPQSSPPSSSSSVSIPVLQPQRARRRLASWLRSSAPIVCSAAFVSRPSRAPESLRSFYALTHARLQSATVVQARQPSSRCGAFLPSRGLQTSNATSKCTCSWYLTAPYDRRV